MNDTGFFDEIFGIQLSTIWVMISNELRDAGWPPNIPHLAIKFIH